MGGLARDLAYGCFLGVGGAVAVLVLADVAGGVLPAAFGQALVVFVLAPLTAAGFLAGVAGIGLTLWVRTDPRLYALSVATAALFVLWVRHGTLGVSPRLTLLHTGGAVLFSLRWIEEKVRGRRSGRGAPPRDPAGPDAGPS